jgi:S1-C subfamily serine protease
MGVPIAARGGRPAKRSCRAMPARHHSSPAVPTTLLTLILAAGTAWATVAPFARPAQQIVDEATITFVPPICTGVVVGDVSHAITAAHCIGDEQTVQVALYDGRQTQAVIERLDRDHDVALLRLQEAVPVTPLRVATRLPQVGDALYFGGRQDRKGSAQVFAVLRLGRCPSLPEVDHAIFTNLQARKGDSGAPLVNRSLEVVGLVHGGTRCNIATPVVGFSPES